MEEKRFVGFYNPSVILTYCGVLSAFVSIYYSSIRDFKWAVMFIMISGVCDMFDGTIGQYCRSRSGCYFCFFQQRIEWIWLYEQHPDLFKKAMDYEKDGYTWIQGEPLSELIRPERVRQIKLEQIKKQEEDQ